MKKVHNLINKDEAYNIKEINRQVEQIERLKSYMRLHIITIDKSTWI